MFSKDILQTHKKQGLFGKGLNPFPNKPWFLSVCRTSLLKTLWENQKLQVTSNFSFSRSVFYPFGELCPIFIKFKIVVCKVFQFGSLKFIVWERVKSGLCGKESKIEVTLYEMMKISTYKSKLKATVCD